MSGLDGVWSTLQTALKRENEAGKKRCRPHASSVLERKTKKALPDRSEEEYKPEQLHHAQSSEQSKESFIWKGVKFSPDGLCILANAEDHTIRLFEPPNLDQATLAYNEGNCVYDLEWYPLMNSSIPSTCCFAATSQGRPIHLWDAYTGSMRASYRAVNEKEELDSPISLRFSRCGTSLFAGVNRGVYVFDIRRPGSAVSFWKTSPTKRSRLGQRGLLSTMDCNPNGSGMLAVGSYNGTIGLYVDNDPDRMLALVTAHSRGVSGVRFSPCGTYLFSGGRMDGELHSFDVRMFARPVMTFPRQVATNQRIQFDLSPCGRYLFTGCTSGRAFVFDLRGDAPTRPRFQSVEYQQPVNGVSCRPAGQQLTFALCTGARQEGDYKRPCNLAILNLPG